MKLKILGMLTGAALLGMQSTPSLAHTDVRVGFAIGVPAPVHVEYTRVYDYGYRRYVHVPRHDVRYCKRHRHDRGWHRGHARHQRRHY
jgi:hypothetical protein